MKLYEGLHIATFPDERVEICAGMETLLCFPRLSGKLIDLLQHLICGCSRADLKNLARRQKLPWPQVAELLEYLERAELLEPTKALRPGTEDGIWGRIGGANLRQAYRNRRFHCISLNRLDLVGAQLARHLAQAGIGAICLPPGSYRKDGATEQEITQLRQELSISSPRTHLYTASKRCNLAVCLQWGAANPTETRRFMRRKQPHLNITVGHDYAEIGPLTIPGLSPCINCVGFHRQLQISDWTHRIAQLQQAPYPPPETALAALTAALANAQILAYLDQRDYQPGQITRLDMNGQIRSEDFVCHPHCGCCELTHGLAVTQDDWLEPGSWLSSWSVKSPVSAADSSSSPVMAVASPAESVPGSSPAA